MSVKGGLHVGVRCSLCVCVMLTTLCVCVCVCAGKCKEGWTTFTCVDCPEKTGNKDCSQGKLFWNTAVFTLSSDSVYMCMCVPLCVCVYVCAHARMHEHVCVCVCVVCLCMCAHFVLGYSVF